MADDGGKRGGSVFAEWTCTFPGKMGLSWKRAWDGVGTREEAEAVASRNCNVVAVPLQLFETMKEHERRMVESERRHAAFPALLSLIEDLQWKGMFGVECPCCRATRPDHATRARLVPVDTEDGHQPGCRLAATLRKAKGVENS